MSAPTIHTSRRTAQHHERLAEELVDLAQQHMHRRDEAMHRHRPGSRRTERRHLQNATWFLSVAQVHAALAIAKRTDQ